MKWALFPPSISPPPDLPNLEYETWPLWLLNKNVCSLASHLSLFSAFSCIPSPSFHNGHLRQRSLFPFHSWGNWGSERLSGNPNPLSWKACLRPWNSPFHLTALHSLPSWTPCRKVVYFKVKCNTRSSITTIISIELTYPIAKTIQWW